MLSRDEIIRNNTTMVAFLNRAKVEAEDRLAKAKDKLAKEEAIQHINAVEYALTVTMMFLTTE